LRSMRWKVDITDGLCYNNLNYTKDYYQNYFHKDKKLEITSIVKNLQDGNIMKNAMSLWCHPIPTSAPDNSMTVVVASAQSMPAAGL